jgi:hypothetical protein
MVRENYTIKMGTSMNVFLSMENFKSKPKFEWRFSPKAIGNQNYFILNNIYYNL